MTATAAIVLGRRVQYRIGRRIGTNGNYFGVRQPVLLHDLEVVLIAICKDVPRAERRTLENQLTSCCFHAVALSDFVWSGRGPPAYASVTYLA